MSKEKESPALTEDQIFIKEKLTDIGCVLGFDEDSTGSILNYDFKESNLGALLDILRLPQAQFITELDLSYESIKTKEIRALVKGLKGTNITTLNLSDNHIGNEGAIALAEGLKDTNITTLCLFRNSIGTEGAIALATHLKDSKITTLSLIGNYIGEGGVIALAKGVKGSNITTLDLRANDIGNEGAIALATLLKDSNIAILVLFNNDIGEKGAESLVKNLENTSIRTTYMIGEKEDSFDCINSHQQALADRVAKLYREGNKSVSLKTWNFYINMGEAVLEDYLREIRSTYKSDALLQKFKEIWGEDIDKVALESLSEIRVLDLHKLILEYWDRDFKPTPETCKQLLLPTPSDTTIEVVKEEEALTKALTSSLHGREVITPGDWVPRSINSGSHSSSSSSTSTMSSSEMAYSDSVSYSMSSYYESTPSTTDISLSGAYEAISDSQGV